MKNIPKKVVRPVFPAPETIQPGDWTIHHDPAHARVSLRTREMWVPLQNDPHMACIRAHEMAHVAFTPKNASCPKDVSEFTLQAVEDFRVNMLAHKAGVDFSAGAPQHMIDGALLSQQDNPKNLVLLALAMFPPERDAIMARIHTACTRPEVTALFPGRDAHVRDTIRDAIRMMERGSKRYTFARTKAVAKWIDEQFDKPEVSAEVEAPIDDPKPGTLGALIKGDGESGDMQVRYPYLDKKTLQPRGGFRPVEEGTMIRAPWRVTTDGRIFRREADRKGSKMSVLVDCSGSMGMDASEVRAIVDHTPAAVIAGYSGHGKTGSLQVFAHKGKMTTDARAYTGEGGNIVDLPALQWLKTQPQPRYWICDGAVTGQFDRPSIKLTEKCMALAATIDARRFHNYKEFSDFLLKTRKGRS